MEMIVASRKKKSAGRSTQIIQEFTFEYTPSKPRRIAHGRELTPDEMLWRSVLGQAVRDIFSSNPEEREEAILWMGTDDFLVICELSQVEPDNMREQMASLARMPMALARKYGLLLKTEIMRGIHHD